MKDRTLEIIRRFEERLAYADPKESARIAKKLARLKNEWIET